jgi:hypothetical protein
MLIRNRIWLAIGATLVVLFTMLTWILPLLLSGDGEDDDLRTTEDPFPEVVLAPAGCCGPGSSEEAVHDQEVDQAPGGMAEGLGNPADDLEAQ